MKRHVGQLARGLAVVLVTLVLWIAPVQAGFVFDLADAVGGGNGTLPGTGGNGNITAPPAFTASGLAVVDGTFMPNTNAATPATISTTALTYDFSAETSYGNQYGAWLP